MLRPLNSAMALITVRMSAPSTSIVKVPAPVRTIPTCFMALDSCAPAGACSTDRQTPIARMRPRLDLTTRIGLVPLPRQRHSDLLGLSIQGQVHDHCIPL